MEMQYRAPSNGQLPLRETPRHLDSVVEFGAQSVFTDSSEDYQVDDIVTPQTWRERTSAVRSDQR